MNYLWLEYIIQLLLKVKASLKVMGSQC